VMSREIVAVFLDLNSEFFRFVVSTSLSSCFITIIFIMDELKKVFAGVQFTDRDRVMENLQEEGVS